MLTVELVPSSCWYTNVRSNVSRTEWDRLRRATYRAAKYRCEICGGRGPQHPVECHEVWEYDDETHVQRLGRLIALCPACHEVKHLGLAQLRGREPEARWHLARVNGWTDEQVNAHLWQAWDDYHRRSAEEWTLDLSALDLATDAAAP